MINLDNIAERLSNKFGVSKNDSRIFIEGTFEEIAKILVKEKKEIRIKNFGTFKFGKTAGRTTQHPVTHETINIGNNVNIRFKAATKLKNDIHESFKGE